MIQIGEDGLVGLEKEKTPEDKPKWSKWDTIAVVWLGLVVAFLLTLLLIYLPKFTVFCLLVGSAILAGGYLIAKYGKN